ncbi:hypothetical protein PC123_g17280 [Phytophthora cactorum]|nr:hypothetical protein PC123_g17280 [Phytophthora cactorum]
MRRSGSRSCYSTSASARGASNERERVFESLQRQLATQNLNDRSSEAGSDYEEKRSVPQGQESVAVAPTTALCRFFVLGRCRYGSRCTFSHSLPAQVSECAADETEGLSAAAALVDCPFFLRGNCKYGEHCRLRHNPAMLPGASIAASARSAPRMGRFPASNSSATVRQAFWPITLRSLLLPGLPALVASVEGYGAGEKRKVVEAYKSHLALRECKYFNGLFGSCPFGPRCFYAHRDSEGRDVKHLDRPKRSTKSRHGRNGRQGGDAALQSLLQQYSHLFRFFEVADWDDFDLVGGLYDSDDSDDDYFEYGFSDDDYDTE